LSPDSRESRIQRQLHNISPVYGALRTKTPNLHARRTALFLVLDGERVPFFRRIDYAHGNKQKKMTLEAEVSAQLYPVHCAARLRPGGALSSMAQ
jgi:hypothetical protein